MGRGIGDTQYAILTALVKSDGAKEFGALQYPFPIEKWGAIPNVLYTLHMRGLVRIELPASRKCNSIALRGAIIHLTDEGRSEYERVSVRFASAAANGSRQLDWTTERKGQ